MQFALYGASSLFVKLSLFLLFLRLFNVDRLTRWFIYAGIVACVLFDSAGFLFILISCLPGPDQSKDLTAWYTRSIKCAEPSLRFAVAEGLFSSLSNIYLFVIPVRLVFGLHLPFLRKLGVSAVFATGVMSVYFLLSCMKLSLQPLIRMGYHSPVLSHAP